MLDELNIGDTVVLHIEHPYTPQFARGDVVQSGEEQIRIRVQSPPFLREVMIADDDYWDDSLTAYKGLTAVRLGEVVWISVVKYDAHLAQARVTDGGEQEP